MTRVALVARPAEGGIRTHLINLARHLDRADWPSRLYGPRSLLEMLPADVSNDAQILDVTARPSPADFATAFQLARALRPGEIVHAHGIRAAWICALAKPLRSFPLIVTLHNIPPESILSRAVLAFISRRADRFIAVSQAIGKTLPIEKTRVISNGIEIEKYQNGNRAEARAAWRLPEDALVVGCIARLSPEKGVDLILEAARQRPDIRFLVAGDGPEREDLIAKKPDNVRLLGRLDDVAPLLKATDVLVIPSRAEGQGIVALEAFAAGCPVLASDAGGLPETIHDGIRGLLFPAGDPQGIIRRLDQLAASPELRGKLAQAAHGWVTHFGSVQTMCRSVQEVYLDAVRPAS